MNMIGMGYKRTLRDFGRINDHVPNLVKSNLLRIIREMNKLLGDFSIKK